MSESRLILFRIERHFLALPISIVREVVSLEKLDPGTNVDDRAEYRGEKLQFVDICGTVDLKTDEMVQYKDAILIKNEGVTMGIRVSHVLDVIKDNDFKIHPSLIHLSALQRRLIRYLIEVHRSKVMAMRINEIEFLDALKAKAREDSLLTDVNTDQSSHARQLALKFDIADRVWCVEIQFIDRILPHLPLSSFPGMQSSVLGIRQVQGEVMPVLSAEGLFGHTVPDRFNRLLTLRRGSEVIGLAVQKVRDIVDLSSLQVADGSEVLPYTKSVFGLTEEDRILSLNVDELFDKGAAS